LRASFVPDKPHRELRELTRYRRRLIQLPAQVINRIHKVLEGANIKLASVVTDVMGVSGRAMLEALAGGEQEPTVLAGLARGTLRSKQAELEQALQGTIRLTSASCWPACLGTPPSSMRRSPSSTGR
jgi:transposase